MPAGLHADTQAWPHVLMPASGSMAVLARLHEGMWASGDDDPPTCPQVVLQASGRAVMLTCGHRRKPEAASIKKLACAGSFRSEGAPVCQPGRHKERALISQACPHAIVWARRLLDPSGAICPVAWCSCGGGAGSARRARFAWMSMQGRGRHSPPRRRSRRARSGAGLGIAVPKAAIEQC